MLDCFSRQTKIAFLFLFYYHVICLLPIDSLLRDAVSLIDSISCLKKILLLVIYPEYLLLLRE